MVLSGWSQYAAKESAEWLIRLNANLKGIGLSPAPADPDSIEGPLTVEGSSQQLPTTTTAIKNPLGSTQSIIV